MGVSDIFSIVSFLTTCFVGIILYKQIKSQKEIIEQYKEYVSTFDLKKIKEIYELKHRSIISHTNILLDNSLKELNATIGNQFDELASFAGEILLLMDNEQRENF